MGKQRQEASKNHVEMLTQSSEQQMNTMLALVGEISKKP